MGVATSKDEYFKNARGLATGFGRTVDFADGQVGTTVQSEGGIGASAEELPGQVFGVDQLPDPEVARAYGLPPLQISPDLVLETDEAEKHIQGKDVLDLANSRNGGLRDQLDDPALAFDNTVVKYDEAALALHERTGENADGLLAEDDPRLDDTGSGQPIDPEGVQQPDAGGTDSVPAADGGVQDSKENKDGDTVQSGAVQGEPDKATQNPTPAKGKRS